MKSGENYFPQTLHMQDISLWTVKGDVCMQDIYDVTKGYYSASGMVQPRPEYPSWL